MRFLAALLILLGSSALAAAQITTTPGPGGIPIAPGAPVRGYTPGGVGIGGGRIAPGPAAQDVPMYRRGPGGVRVLETPAERSERRGAAATATAPTIAPCEGQACLPEGLRLTIDSGEAAAQHDGGAAIDSMAELRTALRACWAPAAEQNEVEMSVRFSFRRTGELMGPPFVTYATPGLKAETRQDFRRGITSALDKCAPVKFSPAFASAVAGRPLSVRFVDRARR